MNANSKKSFIRSLATFSFIVYLNYLRKNRGSIVDPLFFCVSFLVYFISFLFLQLLFVIDCLHHFLELVLMQQKNLIEPQYLVLLQLH